MQGNVTCIVHWSNPITYKQVSQARIPGRNAVYVIMIENDGGLSVLRIGATKDVRQRMLSYRILNFIPATRISYFLIDDCILESLKPFILQHYTETPVEKWRPHLRQMSIDDCVARELRSIEYKVERILLEEYKRRHGTLPPGNPRTGSNREYLQRVAVVEVGSFEVMQLKPAILSPIRLVPEQILELIK